MKIGAKNQSNNFFQLSQKQIFKNFSDLDKSETFFLLKIV